MRNFNALLEEQWKQSRFLCVGLDPDLSKLPSHITGSAEEKILTFNREIIDATKDVVCAYKPNSAFYEAFGEEGWRALKATCEYIHATAPDVAIILDAKRGDIGNTNEGYIRMAFDILAVDAITVQPYMGGEALAPFLARKEKGIIVLCRTSNPGAHEFQNKVVDGELLYVTVAKHVRDTWNEHGNCALVVGATAPHELEKVRELVPQMPLLIPGIGAQGGDLEATVRAGKRAMIIAVSRAVIYASSGTDFADAARNQARVYDSAIRAALVQ